jgi:putative transposase
MRYIEANPLRAGLVSRPEDWKWSGLHLRMNDPETAGRIMKAWPVDMPNDYLQTVNQPLQRVFLDQVRTSVVRGRPLGMIEWVEKKVSEYGLESTVREPHRPRSK